MIFGILKVIGIVLFLYLIWRNLKDDYLAEDLVAYSWLAVLVFLIGGRLAYGVENWGIWNENWIDWFLFWEKPGSMLVGGYGCLVAVTIGWCLNKGWKVWSFMEDLSPILLGLLIFWAGSEGAWVVAGVLVVGYLIGWWLGKRYRSFAWYRSGKKGFVFWSLNAILWLILAVVSLGLNSREIVAGLELGLSLISGIGLVILGDVFGTLGFIIRKK